MFLLEKLVMENTSVSPAYVRCHSTHVVKNGKSSSGKRNYLCRSCKRQFLSEGQGFFVTEEKKQRIHRHLKERSSLRAIGRIEGLSLPTVQKITNAFYADNRHKGLVVGAEQKKR